MQPVSIQCVAPSRVAMGETFALKIKLRGTVHAIPCAGNFSDRKPALRSPFNLNVARQIQFHDNVLPEWQGRLAVTADPALAGPDELVFNGRDQGCFPGDTRPIRVFDGFSLQTPGFHFIRVTDLDSHVTALSNPIFATRQAPDFRLYWGDPHWQTFFSDGIRCPEELYAFARDEGFLDFGAISDHMEAVTDLQWDYFQAATNHYNVPGHFATLIGQEWTHHNPARGAPGHRNIYYRGSGGPVLRSTDPDCDTLVKLWHRLDTLRGVKAIAIPHHSANVIMGTDWEQGWNPRYEKAVEIHSVWGSSEKHRDDGNTMPIAHCKGEQRGRHVIDALRRGYRLGFVGGGDIHDGRPGESLHAASYPPHVDRFWPSGFTAVRVPMLTREAVFDAIHDHNSYATTQSRIYLDTDFRRVVDGFRLTLRAASEETITAVALVVDGVDVQTLQPDHNERIVHADNIALDLPPESFCYVRVTTGQGNMAWSSPCWT